MANNYVQNGDVITVTNATGADVVSGEPFVAGATVVVAAVDIADGETGSAHVRGVFSLPMAAVTLAAGDQVNLASGDITSGAGDPCGIAAAAATSGDATCEVNLNVNNGAGT